MEEHQRHGRVLFFDTPNLSILSAAAGAFVWESQAAALDGQTCFPGCGIDTSGWGDRLSLMVRLVC